MKDNKMIGKDVADVVDVDKPSGDKFGAKRLAVGLEPTATRLKGVRSTD